MLPTTCDFERTRGVHHSNFEEGWSHCVYDIPYFLWIISPTSFGSVEAALKHHLRILVPQILPALHLLLRPLRIYLRLRLRLP